MLTLDEDELRAVAYHLGHLRADEHAVSIALGEVRLRARGLLSGPESLTPPRLDAAVAELVGTYLSPEVSIAVAVDGRNANLRLTFHGRGDRVVTHSVEAVADAEWHTFDSVSDPVEALLGLLDAPHRARPIAGQLLELRSLEGARRAAAVGDLAVVAEELEAAGADEPLTGELAEALLHAERIAQLVRPSQRSLTVLIARGAAWTFCHAAPDRPEVLVERPSAQRIREHVAHLWAR